MRHAIQQKRGVELRRSPYHITIEFDRLNELLNKENRLKFKKNNKSATPTTIVVVVTVVVVTVVDVIIAVSIIGAAFFIHFVVGMQVDFAHLQFSAV